uniref:NYN domain-containing protein n=1 Tax=Chlorobium chlorochromatii (strain CaD3) TaxID=340177 RepID=Q3AP07_CHLCH
MNRVVFIVDGFNLYHSLKAAQAVQRPASTKWLDLCSLFSSQLYHFGKDAVLHKVFYISALAVHLEASNPNLTKRHQAYIKCLQANGVITLLNRFKRKDVFCKLCKRSFYKYEEKETDVMLATTLFEQLATDNCDTVVLVTGDTDLAPAIRSGQKLFPHKLILFAFPYGTKTTELKTLAPASFTLSSAAYAKHQFPNPFILSDGTTIPKPIKW